MAITFDAKKNFAYSVVATAPSPAASGTSLVVGPGDGAKFPTPPFNAVIWPTGVQPTTTNAEVVRVTNISTDTFTITRAQEGSAARTVVINDQIAVNITAKSLTDIQAAFSTASQITGPIGAIVMWPSDTAPTGWLFCRGQAISRATYAALFAITSTTYGAGDGSTTFNVPNFELRLPIGKNSISPLNTLGATSGSWDHTHGAGTLTVASHTHGPGTLGVAAHSHDSGTLTVALHTHGPGSLANTGHDHGVGTLATSSAGSHDHGGATGTTGAHTHTVSTPVQATAGGDFSTVEGPNPSTSSAGDHSHTISSGGSHTHSITGNTQSVAITLNNGVSASTAPAVSSGNTGNTAPAVNAGATAATAPAVNAGATAAANPPVLTVNFIIRATLEI